MHLLILQPGSAVFPSIIFSTNITISSGTASPSRIALVQRDVFCSEPSARDTALIPAGRCLPSASGRAFPAPIGSAAHPALGEAQKADHFYNHPPIPHPDLDAAHDGPLHRNAEFGAQRCRQSP
jgi:hypothetical protein